MSLLTLLMWRDGNPSVEPEPEPGECTFTYDVTEAYTYAPDSAYSYSTTSDYTYDPCADD